MQFEGPLLKIIEASEDENILLKTEKRFKKYSELSTIIDIQKEMYFKVTVDISSEVGINIFRNLTYLCDTDKTVFNDNSTVTIDIPYINEIDRVLVLIGINTRITEKEMLPIGCIKGEYRNISGECYGESHMLFEFNAADFWLMIDPPIRGVLSTIMGKDIKPISSCGGHLRENIHAYVEMVSNKFTARYLQEIIKDTDNYKVDYVDNTVFVFYKNLEEKEKDYIETINKFM